MSTLILGIESSCDDTSAAVTEDTKILANIVAGQEVHKNYGGYGLSKPGHIHT